jgi:hypothetical protein
MSWGVGNPRYIELDVFLIDWGYSVKILDIVGHVRFLPETSGFGQVEGLASRVSIDCKLNGVDFLLSFNILL